MDQITRTVVREAFPITYYTGKHLSFFYEKMRAEKKIFGNRCPKCGNVYVPPVEFCRKCFVETGEDWVECSTEGVLWNYTILRVQFPGYVLKPPFVYSYIKLDGSDDWFIHIMGEANLDKLHVGMKIEVVWHEQSSVKQANIGYVFQPIKYFRPVDPAFRVSP